MNARLVAEDVEGGVVVGHGFGRASQGQIPGDAFTEEAAFEVSTLASEVEALDVQSGGEKAFRLEEKEQLVAEGDDEVRTVEGVEGDRAPFARGEARVFTGQERNQCAHRLGQRRLGRRPRGLDREVSRVVQESKHLPPRGAEGGS